MRVLTGLFISRHDAAMLSQFHNWQFQIQNISNLAKTCKLSLLLLWFSVLMILLSEVRPSVVYFWSTLLSLLSTKNAYKKLIKFTPFICILISLLKTKKNQQTLARLDCFVKLQMFWKIRIKEKLNDESRHKLDIKRTNRFKVNKVWVKTCEIYLWFVETAQEKLKWQKLNQINDIFEVSMRSTTVFG